MPIFGSNRMEANKIADTAPDVLHCTQVLNIAVVVVSHYVAVFSSLAFKLN